MANKDNDNPKKILDNLLGRFDSDLDQNSSEKLDSEKLDSEKQEDNQEENQEDIELSNEEVVNYIQEKDLDYINERPDIDLDDTSRNSILENLNKMKEQYQVLFEKKERPSKNKVKEDPMGNGPLKEDLDDLVKGIDSLDNLQDFDQNNFFSKEKKEEKKEEKIDDIPSEKDLEKISLDSFSENELDFKNLENTFNSIHVDDQNLEDQNLSKDKKEQKAPEEITQASTASIKKDNLNKDLNDADLLDKAFEEGFESLKIASDFKDSNQSDSNQLDEKYPFQEEASSFEKDNFVEDNEIERPSESQLEDEQIKLINNQICKLPDTLQDKVYDFLLEEKIPRKDFNALILALINGDEQKVKKTVDDILKENKKKKSKIFAFSPAFSFYRNLGLLIFGLFLIFIFYYQNQMQKKEKAYKALFFELEKGDSYYKNANEKFKNIQKKYPDKNWELLYTKEYIEIGSPIALYYAHKFLLGEDSLNEKWKEKYVPRFLNERFHNRSNNLTPQSFLKRDFLKLYNINKKYSDFLSSYFLTLKENVIYIFDYLFQKNNSITPLFKKYPKEASLSHQIIDMYKAKAAWAHRYNQKDDLNFFMEEIVEKIYPPLFERYPKDRFLYSSLAQAYIYWGKLLQKMNDLGANIKYDQASSIYKEMLQSERRDLIALYGLLNISFIKRDRKDILKILYLIEKYQEGDFSKNIEEKNQVYTIIKYLNLIMKEPHFLKYSLRETTQKINKIFVELNKLIEEKKYIFPELYYYAGRHSFQKADYYASIEYYIKGLLSFYYQNRTFLYYHEFQVKDIKSYSEFLKLNMEKLINYILNNFNINHMKIQSKLFNAIAESFMKIMETLPSNAKNEQIERESLFEVAKKSFILAITKNLQDETPWYNLANLYYNDFLHRIYKAFHYYKINNPSNLAESKRSPLEINFKIKEYYLNALLLLAGEEFFYNLSFKEKEDLLERILIKFDSKKLTRSKIDFLYKLGFIYYQEEDYKNASAIWNMIRQKNIEYDLNPSLNFALGNVYLHLNNYSYAKNNYLNILDFYLPIIKQNKNSFNINDPKQRAFFIQLAKIYNNLGVAYHLQSEKEENNLVKDNLRKEALFYYYKAKEFLGFISGTSKQTLNLKSTELNLKKVFENIVLMTTAEVPLKKKVMPYDQSIQNMIIDDLDVSLFKVYLEDN